ncbi:MAG: endonuclease, partial [Marinirhabdus sp.]
TAHRRLAAAHANRKIIATIKAGNENAKIIVMGDFNDNPKSDSIHTLKGTDLYNPMEMAHTHGTGSLSHRGQRDMFDQILVSNSFLAMHDNPFRFEGAKVFNPDTLKVYKGRFKGLPFRTFAGPRYLGGFSDHFPVYALFSVAVQ